MVKKAETLKELLNECPNNIRIMQMLIKTWSIINDRGYNKMACKISGGSDSDIMMDVIWKCDRDNKVDFVWFDTGLEYQATKDHIVYLKNLYGVDIHREQAIVPIPLSSRKYGQPIINKRVSDYIGRLQKHNFQWEDESYEKLVQKYPNCQTALKWWCNTALSKQFCIAHNKGLKEYLMQNPPTFPVSYQCCTYAKKKVGDRFMREGGYELDIIGVRKAEGGPRATAYKSCFTHVRDDWHKEDAEWDSYRPLFWLTKQDKQEYENSYHIQHSACYSTYGLTRTGCAGCPLGRHIDQELQAIQRYEPAFYQAAQHTFHSAYEFQTNFHKFREMMLNTEHHI